MICWAQVLQSRLTRTATCASLYFSSSFFFDPLRRRSMSHDQLSNFRHSVGIFMGSKISKAIQSWFRAVGESHQLIYFRFQVSIDLFLRQVIRGFVRKIGHRSLLVIDQTSLLSWPQVFFSLLLLAKYFLESRAVDWESFPVGR